MMCDGGYRSQRARPATDAVGEFDQGAQSTPSPTIATARCRRCPSSPPEFEVPERGRRDRRCTIVDVRRAVLIELAGAAVITSRGDEHHQKLRGCGLRCGDRRRGRAGPHLVAALVDARLRRGDC
jgi:hypothetical protein